MDETTREVAKTANKALEVSEKLGSFFSEILGDAFKEIGVSLHDWTKYYRYKNLLKIYDKIQFIQNDRKIKGKISPLPMSLAIPMIEAASIEEDENLQEKWAMLIANASDPDHKTKIKKVFITTLSSLDSTDAVILDWFSTQGWKNELGYTKIETITENTKIEKNDIKISVSNLHNLGLIEIGVPSRLGNINITLFNDDAVFRLTHLGWSLLAACKCEA